MRFFALLFTLIFSVTTYAAYYIPDGSISSSKLGTNSVTTVKITDGNVTRAKLAAGANAPKLVVSVTSAVTLDLTTTDIAKLSGASFNPTLPDAVANDGKEVTLWHNGTSNTQVYCILTTSAQTVAGIASGSYCLYTNSETLTLLATGGNWSIRNHYAQTAWSTAVAMTITGSTTNPSKGVMTVDHIQWRRNGSDACIYFEYVQSAATGSAAGSGNYLVLLPDSLSADVSTYTTPNTQTTDAASSTTSLGSWNGGINSTNPGYGAVELNDATHFRLVGQLAGSWTRWSSGAFALTNTTINIGGTFCTRISGWRP